MSSRKSTTTSIVENEHVIEILNILKKHQSSFSDDFNAIFNCVVTMEQQLESVIKELAEMRHNLVESEKYRHPIKHTMEKATITLQAQALGLRDKLTVVKQSFISGCKSAVDAFKENFR